MKFWKNIFFIGLIGILISSCTYSDDHFEDADAYKVNVSALNVRQDASVDAGIVGKLKMGDTIYAKELYNKWIIILYNGETAYVDGAYLTKFAIEKHQELNNDEMKSTENSIIQLIDKYNNWKIWEFWLITVVILIISFILFTIGTHLVRGNDAVNYWAAHKFMGMNQLPGSMLVIGFLFGVVYYFWPIDVQGAMFTDPFWWFPTGKGFLYWYLWFLALGTVFNIFVFFIYDIITFKAFSILRIVYFLIISGYFFVSMVFFASTSIVVLIFVFIILLTIQFATTSKVSPSSDEPSTISPTYDDSSTISSASDDPYAE